MARYNEYKDSGIPWIGEIPSHWNRAITKFFFYLKGRIGWQGLKADEFIDEGPFLITGTDFENGRVIWDRCYHISEERYKEAPEIHVKDGDLLITKDGTVGKLAYIDKAPKQASLNSHLLIMRNLKPSLIYTKYLFWYISSKMFEVYTDISQRGSIMASLSQEKIGNFSFPLPPFKEQKAISLFLDVECARIDTIISKQDKRVKLLYELRQSVICQAITKGINEDASMKDSGITWIGKMPSSWSLWKSSHLFAGIGSGTTPPSGDPSYYDDNGYNWLQTGDLNDGYIVETSRRVSEKAVKEKNLRFYPHNSVVIAMYGATIGKVGILAIETCTNQACCVLPPSKKVLPKFAYYHFLAAKQSLITQAAGGGQPNISQDIIRRHKIPIPASLEEQKGIVDYIDERIRSFDNAISKANHQIDLLREYKQSLITEVVTGKRKVC